MALITQLDFVGVDKTGRVISVKDSTGLYSTPDNEGGYGGGVNLDISNIDSILFTISEYDSDTIKKLRFVRVDDPNHPEYLIQPSIDDIANGNVNVEFTSIVLGLTETQDGLKAFSDGVYDINMYTLHGYIYATGFIDTNIIYRENGTGLDIIYNNADFIVVGNDVYTIDKSVPSDPDSLTLVENLKEEASGFYQVYRANVKGMNGAASDCCGTQEAGKVAESDGCGCMDKKLDNLFKLWMYKIAAQIDFNCSNYIQANDLLKGAQKVCKSLNCKC